MKIAFITPEYVTEEGFSGGLANYLGRISVALHELGHDVHVFTKSSVSEVLSFQGVTVHRVVPLWDRRMILDHIDPLIPRSFYTPYQDTKAAWCLHREWKRVNRTQAFDIVQLANVLSVGLFFRWTRRPPTVMRLSSYRPAWDTIGGTPMTRAVRIRWWMEKMAICGIRNIYAPTHFVADLTKENYGVESVDVIETPFFHEQPEQDDALLRDTCGGNPYLLFFGRMTKMKGVHRLAEALPGLLSRYPEMNVVLIGNDYLAPDGGSMQQYVRDLTQAHADRVKILKAVRHDQLYPFIRDAKAITLPSIIDNLPNTCLEAMAHRKVVVATRGSCFEQLIEDNKSGILCRADDAQDLKEGITRAWDLSDEQRRSIGEKAVVRIQELAPEVAIPKLVHYYESLIQA